MNQSIVEGKVFIASAKKILFISDNESTDTTLIGNEETPTQQIIVSNLRESQNDLKQTLSKQRIGTVVIAQGSLSFVKTIKQLSLAAGFGEQDIFVKSSDKQEETVFCVHCYKINSKKSETMECHHCQTPLLVSRHYSRRLDAYLGYICI